MTTPTKTNSSDPGNTRINRYTALLVVKALRKTMPLTEASGYASVSHACSGGTAALIKTAVRMSPYANCDVVALVSGAIASPPPDERWIVIPAKKSDPPSACTKRYLKPAVREPG